MRPTLSVIEPALVDRVAKRFLETGGDLRETVRAVVHGHAHHGSHSGATRRGIPVFNVAAPVEKPNGKSLRSNISQLERRMIAEALDRCRWNKARAARELGLSYPTLLSKIRTLQIERRKRF